MCEIHVPVYQVFKIAVLLVLLLSIDAYMYSLFPGMNRHRLGSCWSIVEHVGYTCWASAKQIHVHGLNRY